MGSVSVLTNSSIIINIPSDYSDSGWDISGEFASHKPCNPGYIKLSGAPIVVGRTYAVNYVVSNYVSGLVKSMLGTASGSNHTSNGEKTDIIVATDNSDIIFYSDGDLTIKHLKIYEYQEEPVDNAITMAFSEDVKRFISYYSWKPEMMLRFLDTFFSFKEGTLWEHHMNETRNNFYGVQYKSKVTFYANVNPDVIKLFYSIRVHSDHVWSAPSNDDIIILPTKGRPAGMKSRIKSGDFKNLQGDFFADFRRNLLDPRYNTDIDRLMKGEELRGKIMEISLENNDTVEVLLSAVDITTTPSYYT